MIALDNCNTTLYDLWLVITVNISKHYRYLVAVCIYVLMGVANCINNSKN